VDYCGALIVASLLALVSIWMILGYWHTRKARGVPPDQARGALRFTLGAATTQQDTDKVAAILPDLVAQARTVY